MPLIVITGPTASGKTTLAIELAKEIGGCIICADSRIVYKDLDIVSAKPDKKEKQGIIHHLIDIKSVDEGIYSAGDFCRDAKKIIDNSNSPVIIQGGTWFYIKSLLDKKSLIGFGKNEALRKEFSKYTNEKLYGLLLQKDSERAKAIHQNNRDKIIRSLELIESIKGKLSEYEREDNMEYDAIWFIKQSDRNKIYEKIDKRVDLMVKSGLYEEWKSNFKKYGKNDILYNTIGYREFFDLEDKTYSDFEEAKDKIKQHTRNFAKRQLSWFRQNEEKFNILSIDTKDDILNRIKL